MRALLVVSKAQATVRALSIRKAGATTLTLLAVSLCGPEPGTVWRARRAVAFYDRRQDTRAGAVSDLVYLISVHLGNLLRDRQPVGVVLDSPAVLDQSLFGHHLGCEAPFVDETL